MQAMRASTFALLLLFFFFFASLSVAQAMLVSNTLGSHMVLQRAPEAARLWGWTAGANAGVNVTFNGRTYRTTSGSDTKWTVALPPTPAGGPYNITITSGAETQVLVDVLFGDVWFCSGQSNMQIGMAAVFNSTQELAKANNYPHIRILSVGQGTNSSTPLKTLNTIDLPWTVANASTLNAGAWRWFSATCYLFGQQLHERYPGVPIGLVSSAFGGTQIEYWMGPDPIADCKNVTQTPSETSILWNSMVVPFLDMRLKGFAWYQGERNRAESTYYRCAFPAMITDWRAKFNSSQGVLPFLFVQLAAWTDQARFVAPQRQAQTSALTLPKVGMATAIDLGDATSPYGNIHPRNKQDVGRRLALAARAIAYGEADVAYLNPNATSATVSNRPLPTPDSSDVAEAVSSFLMDLASLGGSLLSGASSSREPTGHQVRSGAVDAAAVNQSTIYVRVQFDQRSVYGGLVERAVSCPVNSTYCAGLQVQFNKGAWLAVNSSVEVYTSQIEVALQVSPGQNVTGVRYGWNDWPLCSLYSRRNLPALPFLFSL